MRPILIDLHITQAVIDRGIPRDSCNCPIAIAVIEALSASNHKVNYVEIDGSGFQVYLDEGEYKHFPMTANEQEIIDEFISKFDMGESVEPFSLTSVRLEDWAPEPPDPEY